jgi:hypothetical protein
VRRNSVAHRIDAARFGGMGGDVPSELQTNPSMNPTLKTFLVTVAAALVAVAIVNKTPVGKYLS